MSLLDDIVHRIGRDVRMDAGKMLWPGLLAVAAGLTGTAGLGFLTVWAYLTLCAAAGPGPAALMIGLGYAMLAGGLGFLARRQVARPDPDDRPTGTPAAHGNDAADAAAEVAFAAAFVLARYLDRDMRD